AAAGLGERLAEARAQAALGFQPLERGVEGAARHLAAGLRLDLFENRDGVGLVAEPKDGEKDDLLELAEVDLRHMPALQAIYAAPPPRVPARGARRERRGRWARRWAA